MYVLKPSLIGSLLLKMVATVGVVAALSLSPSGNARGNDTLDWLASEPVTLLDLGVIRLKQDLIQVGQSLVTRGHLPMTPTTGAYFDWREKKIIVFLTVRERFADPSEGMCLELFSRVSKGLASRARGQKGEPSWYLEEIFTHDGWGNFTRPKSMRKHLLSSVQLEITVLPAHPMGGVKTVQCYGGLETETQDVTVRIS
jgi:hypothetical protein